MTVAEENKHYAVDSPYRQYAGPIIQRKATLLTAPLVLQLLIPLRCHCQKCDTVRVGNQRTSSIKSYADFVKQRADLNVVNSADEGFNVLDLGCRGWHPTSIPCRKDAQTTCRPTICDIMRQKCWGAARAQVPQHYSAGLPLVHQVLG